MTHVLLSQAECLGASSLSRKSIPENYIEPQGIFGVMTVIFFARGTSLLLPALGPKILLAHVGCWAVSKVEHSNIV